MDILAFTIGNNPVKDYLIALVIFAATFVCLSALKYAVIKLLDGIFAKVFSKTGVLVKQIVMVIGWPLFLVISIFVATQFIKTPNSMKTAFHYIFMVVVTVYVLLSIHCVINYIVGRIVSKKEKEQKEVSTTFINLFSMALKIALWIIAVIFILSNLEYNVTSLIAGFGIGGIVIAFGLQTVLQDLFASFSIYVDKPFVPGDFIIVGNDLGVVKRIGIKSTRIQHLGGQELVISNRELTDTRVHNYKKMEKRRVAFLIGVTYQTPTEKLKRIPGMIKEIIARIEAAEVDRVHFKKYGDFSLIFEIVYYIGTNDYNVYMDTQQTINLTIKEQFEKEQIKFAYPTQTVFLNKK